MFCTNCGKEVPPGDSFCPYCGTPVESAQEKPPAAVQPLTHTPAPEAPRKKRWIVPLAAVACLAVAAAIVLVLVFFIFGGGNSPESAADFFFKAIEQKDAQAIIDNTDLASLGDEPGVEAKFKKYVRDSIPDDYSLEFTGLEYKTSVSGEKATVDVVEGKATLTDKEGKKEVSEISESEGSNKFFMVKKNGKWLYAADTFPDFSAVQQLKEADKSERELESSYATLKREIETIFEEMSSSSASNFAQFDAAYKEQQGKANASIDKFLGSAEETKSQYQSVADLKGAAQYAGYANLRIQQTDKYIEIANAFKDFLRDLGELTSSWVKTPPTSEAAVEQSVSAIVNGYNPKFDQLEGEAGALDDQATTLGKKLNL